MLPASKLVSSSTCPFLASIKVTTVSWTVATFVTSPPASLTISASKLSIMSVNPKDPTVPAPERFTVPPAALALVTTLAIASTAALKDDASVYPAPSPAEVSKVMAFITLWATCSVARVSAGLLFKTSKSAGRPRAALTSASVTPASATKVVMGVTIVASSGAES